MRVKRITCTTGQEGKPRALPMRQPGGMPVSLVKGVVRKEGREELKELDD